MSRIVSAEERGRERKREEKRRERDRERERERERLEINKSNHRNGWLIIMDT